MVVRLTVCESIAAPPDRTLAVLSDYDQLARWMRNVVRMEKLTPGPLAAGSRWKQVRKRFGELVEDLNEVLLLEPPHSYHVRVHSARGPSLRVEYVFRFRLEPEGGGTRLELEAEGNVTGLEDDSNPELMAHMAECLLAADLAALKTYVEAGV